MSNLLFESVAHAALPSHYTHRDKSILMALCYRANADQGNRIWASAADLARIACCSVRNIMTKLLMFVADGILKRLTNPRPRKQADGTIKTQPVVYELNMEKLTELGAKISAELQTKERTASTKSKPVDKSYPQPKLEPQQFLETPEAKQALEDFEKQNRLVDTPGSVAAFIRHYLGVGNAKIMPHWSETLLRWLKREKRVKSFGDRSAAEQAEFWQHKHEQAQLDARKDRMKRCGVQALPGRSWDEIDALCEMVEKRGSVVKTPEEPVIVLADPEVAKRHLAKLKDMFKK